MQLVDWLIIFAYLGVTMALGLYLSSKNQDSIDYLLGGRKLSWWLAGTSMAATTFSIDTPLYICGVVATRGIAGNWEWWSFGIAHVVMIYLFSRAWRRSEVTTDAEFTKLRYGGKMADILRTTKAFLFAIPINCIGIGYAMLAMVKVIDALQLWQSLGVTPGENLKIWSVVGVSVFVLIYCGVSGLTGVVVTDFFQFFLGLFGAFIVAIVAVNHVGGIHQLVPQVQQATDIDVLSFIPLTQGDDWFNFSWSDAAGITASTFSAYLFVQWWSFRRSDGGGEFVQRLLAAKDEAEAEKSAWFFNFMHYIIRTWPWIVVALAAIVIYPNLEDPELAYPKLMLDFLPPVVLGLVVASLIAAFMSTVSTSINWGASYIANDLYLPLVHPQASADKQRLQYRLSEINRQQLELIQGNLAIDPALTQESQEISQQLAQIDQEKRLILVAQLASVLVTALGALAAFYAKDITTVYRLVIAIGTGPGLVLILRWFWWRINATAELFAMVGGFIMGILTTFVPTFKALLPDFGQQLLVISLITAIFWIAAMLLTPPESDATLRTFYQQVRPSGIWRFKDRQRQKPDGTVILLKPAQHLPRNILQIVAATLLLFGSMLCVGGFLLLQSATGWISLIFAVIGGFWLRRLSRKPIPSIPRPGLDDSVVIGDRKF